MVELVARPDALCELGPFVVTAQNGQHLNIDLYQPYVDRCELEDYYSEEELLQDCLINGVLCEVEKWASVQDKVGVGF